MFDYLMEYVCSYRAELGNPPEVVGPTPDGLRVNGYITGGEVEGQKLQGSIRPVGGDWLTIRHDGVGILDVRTTFETHDGALISVAYTGIGDFGEDGYRKFLDGNPPARLSLHTVPRLQASHSDYAWVNRVQFVGIGELDLERFVAAYDLYALR